MGQMQMEEFKVFQMVFVSLKNTQRQRRYAGFSTNLRNNFFLVDFSSVQVLFLLLTAVRSSFSLTPGMRLQLPQIVIFKGKVKTRLYN